MIFFTFRKFGTPKGAKVDDFHGQLEAIIFYSTARLRDFWHKLANPKTTKNQYKVNFSKKFVNY